MAGYTRQSTYTDGDIIQASDSNDEFDQLLAAFNNATGHKHDGTTAEGPVIALIGDPGVATPINKVVVDDTNNRVGVFTDVSGVSIEQFRFQDGVIIPVTSNDIDLGSATYKFKDGYFAGDLTVDGDITLGGSITLGDADTDSITLGAEVDSHVVPNVDNSYDLGSATKEWRNLYVDGIANIDSLVADTADINAGTIDNATIGATTASSGAFTTITASSTLGVTGNTTIGGTLGVTGNQTNTGNLTVNGNTTLGNAATDTVTITADVASNVIPSTDDTYDLGAVGSEWKDLYIDGVAYIDNLTIGASTGITSVDTDLSSVSASDDTLASAKAIKTYVDAQVTAQDLDFQGDTGGALNIDLDSEVLTVAGGTGIDTSGSGNTLTVAIDSTVATLTGTQTLTNKTLTTPVISTISNTGTLTLPTSTDTLVGRNTTDTLTNKSIDASQLTGTVANARLDQQLQDVAGLAVTDGNFIVGNGTNFVAESGATARTSLGLGTAATTASTDYATAAQGTNADTAYGWGDHSAVGYLTSYTETDPIYTASSWYTTTNNSSNWDAAYAWGDHAAAGYGTTDEALALAIALG